MDMYLRTGIGRAVDPRYPSNLFVLIASALSGVGWMIWKLASEGDWGAALGRAGVAGVAAFLGWAIARELDPDRPWTAGVAAVAASVAIGAGPPSLLVAAAVMLAVRITARTTGRPPMIIDLVFISGLAALVGASDAGFAAGVVLGVVVLADRLHPVGAPAWWLPMGGAALAVSVAGAAIWGDLSPAPGMPDGPEWVIVPIAALGLAALGRPGAVAAFGDLTSKPLSLSRVRLGRAVAVVAAAATFLWMGGPGLTSASVVWAALAAAALPGRSSND